MSKNLIGKAAVGAALISLQIVPVSSLKKESVMVLQVQAATISSTYTDEQKVTYTIDQKAGNATASAYSGLSGAAIVIPESISFEGQSYPVVAIGASAFLNSGISSVIIGNNVTDIGTSAFQTTTAYPDFYKASLKSVMLGQNVQSIKTDAFAGNALTNIQFPDSLSKIGSRAFANNFLTTVSFGSNLLDIASKAFQTNNISAIIFANNCATTVESAAFSGSPVEKIIYGAEVTWASDVLNKINQIMTNLL